MIRRSYWDRICIIVVGIFLFLLGNGQYTLFDNSETHYSRVAQEMVQTGDYLSPHFNGQAWHVHPPLYFWLLATHCQVWGWSEFQLRLIEGLCAIGSLLVLYQIGISFFDRRIALLATLMWASSLYTIVMARLAIFDMVLNVGMLLTLYGALMALYNPQKSKRYWLLAGIASGVAVLTKGPIGWLQPALAFFSFLFFKKKGAILKTINFWLGIATSFLIVVPWYARQLFVYGRPFFDVALKDYTWYRFLGVVEGQSGAWWYYFPVLLGFFPWIFYIGVVAVDAIAHKRWTFGDTKNEMLVFSWLFVLASFVFFSVAKTKLPNYILTIFPFLSLIMAHYLLTVRSKRWGHWVATCLGPISMTCLWILSYQVFLPHPYSLYRPLASGFLAILMGSTWVYTFFVWRKKIFVGTALFVMGVGLSVFFLTHFLLPAIEVGKDVKPIARALQRISSPYTLVHYHFFSPYILFYTNHVAVDTTSSDEIKWLKLKQPSQKLFLISDHDHLRQLAREGILYKSLVVTCRLGLVEVMK